MSSKEIVHFYQYLFNAPPSVQDQLGTAHLAVPSFSRDVYEKLFMESAISLSKQPTVLRLSGPIIIVGDIHGNIRDLLRIIWRNGPPPNTKYLFLGDYVDRGDFSLEVLSLLLALQIQFPECIYLIRGNHEFISMNSNYGFGDQIQEIFGDLDLLPLIDDCYENLSLAAIVEEKYFCVHGGLSLTLQSLDILESITKPIGKSSSTFIQDLVEDLVWSDPDPEISYFSPGYRGKGHRFGIFAVAEFLKKNKFDKIIRAHEWVEKGFRIEFNVVTIFSSSDYNSSKVNCAGYIICDYKKGLRIRSIHQESQLQRKSVIFTKPHIKMIQTLSCLKCSKKGKDSPCSYSCRRDSSVLVMRSLIGSHAGKSLPLLPTFS